MGGLATFNHHAWSFGGDFVWMMMMIIGVFLACVALWWR